MSVTEEIVSHDDAQLEAYLEGNEPSVDELARTLSHEVASGEAVPVLLCSGVTGTGVDRVADLLCALSPAARDHDSRIMVGGTADGEGGTEVSVAPNPDGETVVHVFRTVADPFVGQIAMLKVLSGTLRPSDRLRNATTGAEERMPALFRLRGSAHLPADALRTGEVGAVAKLVGSPSGSVLWSRPQGAARPAPLPHRASGLRGQPRPGDAVRRRQAVDGAGTAARRGPDAHDRSGRGRDRSCADSARPTSPSPSSGSRAFSG